MVTFTGNIINISIKDITKHLKYEEYPNLHKPS